MAVINNQNLRLERLQLSRWEVNSYIIVCPQTGQSALVDVPPGALTLLKSLEGSDLKYIILTHSHIDHIAGLAAFQSRMKAPLAVHPADQGALQSTPDLFLVDGETISVGKINISVLFTPGHTPGSTCFRIGEYLISGDTLFPGGPGRTETPADFQQVLKSGLARSWRFHNSEKSERGVCHFFLTISRTWTLRRRRLVDIIATV
jgi:hydroxyacylglutathione hydrolase